MTRTESIQKSFFYVFILHVDEFVRFVQYKFKCKLLGIQFFGDKHLSMASISVEELKSYLGLIHPGVDDESPLLTQSSLMDGSFSTSIFFGCSKI